MLEDHLTNHTTNDLFHYSNAIELIWHFSNHQNQIEYHEVKNVKNRLTPNPRADLKDSLELAPRSIFGLALAVSSRAGLSHALGCTVVLYSTHSSRAMFERSG